jgi:hypothetical protein
MIVATITMNSPPPEQAVAVFVERAKNSSLCS